MAYRQLEEQLREPSWQKPIPKPQRPVGRQRELTALQRILSHVGKHPTPLHTWIWGSQGAGKTHCAQYAASELAETRQASVACSNCWNSNSLYALVNDIVDQFSILRAELQDTRFKIERIKKHMDKKQCIYIIDGIDRLDTKERNAVLYQFHEMGNFWIVAISNETPQKLGIEPRVWSRLSPIFVNFNPYTTKEIIQLLKHDLEKSDHKTKPTAKQLQEIAEQSGGDARFAKKLLTQKVMLGLSDVAHSHTGRTR
ncbi:MAG: AAA family ATPase [bacterium]